MLGWRLDTRHHSRWFLAVAMPAIWISCTADDAAPPANMSEMVALPTGAAGAIPVVAAEPSQAGDQVDIQAELPVEIVTAFLSAEPEMVAFVPGAVGSLLPRQVPPRQAEINVHIAPVTESAACAAAYRVLGFTAVQEEDEPMVLSGNRVELTADQINRLASGPVSLCLEVLTNFDGTVLVSELTVETVVPRALDAEPGVDENENGSHDIDELEAGENANGNANAAAPCQSPTYESFVGRFFDGYCLACHSVTLVGAARNGAPEGFNYDTLEAALPHLDRIRLRAAVEMTMPPLSAPALPTDEERADLLLWIDCGAPE